MRFPIAAIFFTIAGFIFFVIFTVITLLHNTIDDALTPYIPQLTSTSQTMITNELNVIQLGFGIFSALFFLVAILLIFFVDSWRDDPEYYYRP